MICNLCPRRCNAERKENINLNGICEMPLSPKVARASLHFWEEPPISGKNGSGTVFFSGCPLKCIYCQNFDVSRGENGKIVSIERLAEIFKGLEEKGAHNINLVTPTHYAVQIKQALQIYKPEIPVVYNSSGYENVETLKMLEGFVDIFLVDFKYISYEKAKEYSLAENYPQIAKKAIEECYRQQPKCVIENGIMKKGVIVRHLILPQSTKDAMAVFDWVRENTPNAYFSIMSQYLPFGDAVGHKVIGRKITKREYEKVLNYICEFEFKNVYIQELESSSKEFIPDFNLQGV